MKGTLVRQGEGSSYSLTEACIGGRIARHDVSVAQASISTPAADLWVSQRSEQQPFTATNELPCELATRKRLAHNFARVVFFAANRRPCHIATVHSACPSADPGGRPSEPVCSCVT